MYVFISILILIASILLILIVLIQNSKGGGLASGFSSSNQIMGVRKTTDFLEKATWTLAGTVVVLSIVITAFIPRAQHTNQSEIKEQINNAVTMGETLTQQRRVRDDGLRVVNRFQQGRTFDGTCRRSSG